MSQQRAVRPRRAACPTPARTPSTTSCSTRSAGSASRSRRRWRSCCAPRACRPGSPPAMRPAPATGSPVCTRSAPATPTRGSRCGSPRPAGRRSIRRRRCRCRARRRRLGRRRAGRGPGAATSATTAASSVLVVAGRASAAFARRGARARAAAAAPPRPLGSAAGSLRRARRARMAHRGGATNVAPCRELDARPTMRTWRAGGRRAARPRRLRSDLRRRRQRLRRRLATTRASARRCSCTHSRGELGDRVATVGQMSRRPVLTFGLMTAVLASGYGVMFTVLDDFRDEYGIAGVLARCRSSASGSSPRSCRRSLLAPIADRGHARAARALGPGPQRRRPAGHGVRRGRAGAARGPVRDGHRRRHGDARRAPDRDQRSTRTTSATTSVCCWRADVAGFAAGPAVSAMLVPAFGIPAPFLVIAGGDAGRGADRAAHARRRGASRRRRRIGSRSICCARDRSSPV